MVGHKSDHQRDAEETLGCSGRYYINDLVVCNHNGEQVPGLAELRLSFSQLTGLNKHQVGPHSTTSPHTGPCSVLTLVDTLLDHMVVMSD